MKEQDIQTKILKYLKSIGCYVVKVGVASRSGVPDVLVCFNGDFIAIEVKAKGNKASELQLLNIESIKESGGKAIVAYSLEEVKEFIDAINKSTSSL